jgi:hypothetical protein
MPLEIGVPALHLKLFFLNLNHSFARSAFSCPLAVNPFPDLTKARNIELQVIWVESVRVDRNRGPREYHDAFQGPGGVLLAR